MLKKRNVPFTEVDIGWDGPLWDELEKKSGMTTVPQIYLDDTCVGGHDELKALIDSGRFETVFASVLSSP